MIHHNVFFRHLSLCALACQGLFAGPDFSDLLSETTDVSLIVRDISSLNQQLEAHPFQEFLESEAVTQLMDFFRTENAVDEESFLDVAESRFGLSGEDLLELFPGQLSISMDSVVAMMDGELERPDLLIMAETTADEARMQSLMKIQFEHNAEAQKAHNPAVEHRIIERSFMGETLYLDETFNGELTYIEDAYALVDGIFLLASPVERLEAAVESIKEGNDTPMSRGNGFLRASELSEGPDVRFMIQINDLLAPVKTKLANLEGGGSAMAMMGMTPDSFWNALGLDALQSYWMDFNLVEDGAVMYSGLNYTEKKGLLSLLAYTEGPLPEAGFVPEDAVMASVAGFSLSELFRQFEIMLSQASPNLGQMMNLQLLNLQSKIGVDLRAGLLNNFGDQSIAFSVLGDSPDGEQALRNMASVYVFDVPDTGLMGQAIDGLLAMAPQIKPMLTEELFAGEKIFSFAGMPNPNLPEAQTSFHYTLTRSQLVVSSGPVHVLKSTLTELQTPSRDGGFWARDDIVDLVDRLELDQSVGTVAYDLSAMDGAALAYLEMIQHSMPGVAKEKRMPEGTSLEMPFLAAYGIEQGDGLLFMKAIMIGKDSE